MHYLSENIIIEAYKDLISFKVDNPSLLHIFFILKACGFNQFDYLPLNLIQEKAYPHAFQMSSLFTQSEGKPLKYDFINPFEMKSWRGQSPSEQLLKWVNSRIKNDIIGGATTWRRIIKYDPIGGNIHFTSDYLNQLVQLTLSSNKINMLSLALWYYKFSAFPKELNIQELLLKFIQDLHITDDELNILFYTKPLRAKVSYDEKMFDPKVIRNMIGNMDKQLSEWKEDKLTKNEIKLFNIIYEINMQTITPKYIKKCFEVTKQLILSGPPATSKSFLTNEIANEFKIVRRIQFHPQYAYQDFIGGYHVVGTEVKYSRGTLLRLLDDIKLLSKDEKALLIIDEINRANISQVLGEVIQCLDRNYRVLVNIEGKDTEINLPSNLYIIGTMNSSDRSIGNIDIAIRRRFLNLYCAPRPEELLESCTIQEMDFTLMDLLKKINYKLYDVFQDKDYSIGHAVFFIDSFKEGDKYVWNKERLEIVFNNLIIPTIEEFAFGDDSKVIEVLGEKLPSRLAGDEFLLGIKEFLE